MVVVVGAVVVVVVLVALSAGEGASNSAPMRAAVATVNRAFFKRGSSFRVMNL